MLLLVLLVIGQLCSSRFVWDLFGEKSKVA